MTSGGFHDRRTMSPMGLALVVTAHAALLGALALSKPTLFTRPVPVATATTFVPLPPDPPPQPPEPRTETRRESPSVIDRTERIIEIPTVGPTVDQSENVPIPPLGGGAGPEPIPETRAETPPPVRIAATFDPRFASELQPPYPPSEHRAQRGGTVRVLLTIGADGRVRSVQRLAATSDAFWRATERHALAHWRFRPATVDGRAVESTKVMNIFFRIESA